MKYRVEGITVLEDDEPYVSGNTVVVANKIAAALNAVERVKRLIGDYSDHGPNDCTFSINELKQALSG